MEQKSQNFQQSNSLPVKEQSFKLIDQKGQASTVKLLLMDQEFVSIQVFISRSCWQINITLSQAFKIHNVFILNNSIEELFTYIEECFKANQVSLETLDSLAHLTFNQVVVFNKPVMFKITLKQIEMNIQQILQEMSIEFEKMSTKAEETSTKTEKMSSKIEEMSAKAEEMSTKIEEVSKKAEKMYTKVEQMSSKAEEMSTKTEGISTQFEMKLAQAFNKIKQLEEEIQKIKQVVSLIFRSDERQLIYNWVSAGKIVSHLELLYRASLHGFQAQSFNLRCDGKGPLVCFVRSQNQRRFGGYIHLKFQKDLGNYVAANPNNSFLFSLDDKKQYLSNDTSCSYAYNSGSNYGFTMGGGNDLHLSDNCNENQSSYSNLSNTYGKNQGGNNQSLAGSKNFMVEEVEVFEVIYKQ